YTTLFRADCSAVDRTTRRSRHLYCEVPPLPPVGGGSVDSRGTRRWCQRPPRPLDEQSHLVRDQTEVAFRRCQNGEAGAVADAHDEHQPPLHLDDGLGNRSTLEHPRRALGQAGQTRGDRRQLVGPVRREARRGRQGTAVRRNDDRMSDIRYAVCEVSDQPVEFIDLSTHLIPCPSLPAPLSALLPPARHVTALPLRTARTFPWGKPGVWCSALVERCAREAR